LKVALILTVITPFIVAGKWGVVKESDGSVCPELKSDADYKANKHSKLSENCIKALAKVSTNANECKYCPPGLVQSNSNWGSDCFAITSSLLSNDGYINGPSGQTECDQLQDLCDLYDGISFIQGSGEDAKCYCFADEINDCYEENKLYVEGTLPDPMSLEKCFDACKSVTTCEFFTWNSVIQSCGLRSYKPNALVTAPNLRTGTRTGGILPTLNSVYVGDAAPAVNRFQCKSFCKYDSQCKSVIFDSTVPINAGLNNCILNYGPVINVVSLPFNSGLASCEPGP
jgi:hypothetical protein